jgi:hypothetical protein
LYAGARPLGQSEKREAAYGRRGDPETARIRYSGHAPLEQRPFLPRRKRQDSDIRTYEHENPGKKYPPSDAKKYAELTGGFAFELFGNDLAGRLAEVIDDLRTLYTIGYRPTEERSAGVFCRIKVALAPDAPLRSREWRTLAREGYYRK